ncbi:glycogen debranching protein GlgX [Herbaspirillum sp. RTI4]|nr:glycogen debranching protein GlgX [Herbaspirillum sp. RTI4]MDY7579064.1 glycogen debranching protein GlgX [Herbaspirillum sp. RTI4]MEA9982352.1 glycogen debranching protein GlgX [Herbaspirillum sp. RTI4]
MNFPPHLSAGSAAPLGASSDGLGVNFSVFSAHAEKIELCIFDASGRHELHRYALPECTDEIWHGYLPDAVPGMVYGYRAYGPHEPSQGHRFNSNKLLLDPYAKRLIGTLRSAEAVYSYRFRSARADLSFDRRDSAWAMVKAVVTEDNFKWGSDTLPQVPWANTVIYEAHVRGISKQREDIAAPERGTFAALANPRFIEHLQKLGVTTLELMPVHSFAQDAFLLKRQLRNYWGYSTLGFFAAEPLYLAAGDPNEMRMAIRRLHSAGIEVILDVVYNHTCCGNELGPTLSFRGLDNASYYHLSPDDARYYDDSTGCGNTLNLGHPRVLQLVLDSLRYWAQSFHVDGFRFDLSTALGRDHQSFDVNAGFFKAVLQDPVLSQLKLIAEPWDLGADGYQLGQHPPGFAEWNDKFRDGMRRFWAGDAGQRSEFAGRLLGSSDLFDHRHRKPWASINYLASHDGFSLRDLVSYAGKHNEANGEENRDGTDNNCSANWGVEGETDDPLIQAVRDQVQRAMLASVFLAQGTPMLLAGDEFHRTQGGNNNAYCQDNALSWVDWNEAKTPRGKELIAYVSRLTAIRREFAVLQSGGFLHGTNEVAPGIPDVAWFDEKGDPVSDDDWDNPEARAIAVQRAGPGVGQGQGNTDLVLMFVNADSAPIEFSFPMPPRPHHLLLDSSLGNGVPAKSARHLPDTTTSITVPAHGVMVFANRPLRRDDD